MEDNFRVRVDKAFGSMSSSSPSSSSLSSMWCLTVDEIEPKDRPEQKTEPELALKQRPDPFSIRADMEKELEDLDDEIEEEEEEGNKVKKKPDGYNDEEWEIKSSIGLDCTLDYEEEEDEYDKVAVGKEKVRDRLYMKDVNDYETDTDNHDDLSSSFKDYIRDPRANHIAAKIRLKEDAEAAKKINSLQVSEKAPAVVNVHDNKPEDSNLKSILKRKDNQSEPKENQPDSKSKKRVRFDAECKNYGDEESDGAKDTRMETRSMEEDVVLDYSYKLPPDYPSGIPDYMRNPSKYTRYTFESSDVDDTSNRQAYMDFLKLLKRSNVTELESTSTCIDLPKSVTFVPKRKTVDSMIVENCSGSMQNEDDISKGPTLRRNLPVSIAVGVAKDDEACEMEEDEPETMAEKRTSLQKSDRQYRMKSNLESDELS